MQGINTYLSLVDMAKALNIHPYTLETLAQNGTVPHTYIVENGLQTIKFCPYTISEWMQSKPKIEIESSQDTLKNFMLEKFPETIKQLKSLNEKISPGREAKLYSLVKVKNKKCGFVWYVRYVRGGEQVRSRWSTKTSEKKLAERFAELNRSRLLSAYDDTRAKKKSDAPEKNIHKILKSYYSKNSILFNDDVKRGRRLTDKNRRSYEIFIEERLVPFIKQKKIPALREISTGTASAFQTYLLRHGLKAQTINKYFSAIRIMFASFVREGYIETNPFYHTPALKAASETRECYEIDSLDGVFSKKWRNEFHYLLCLLIYTTGLRNSEIETLKMENIKTVKDCLFIDVRESKTLSGIRLVPLHKFVYTKLASYAKKQKKKRSDFLLTVSGKTINSRVYRDANKELGGKLKITPEQLNGMKISFYSGRHFWKTLINAHGLGDVEEYFMGHKVSGDVAKRYNHRDKQGQKMLVKKAKEVFSILDKTLLKS